MTTTLFLVRHAPHEHQHRVQVGRTEGVALADGSWPLVEAVGRRLAGEGLDLIRSSPVQRAQDTAGGVARATGLAVETDDDLTEMDMGDWTGMSFDDLPSEKSYRDWNASKATTGAPGGELSTEVQARMVRAVNRVRDRLPEGRAALVSHGDPIKCLVCACLGLPLDSMHRFDLEPASITTVVVGDWGAKVVRLNERVAQ